MPPTYATNRAKWKKQDKQPSDWVPPNNRSFLGRPLNTNIPKGGGVNRTQLTETQVTEFFLTEPLCSWLQQKPSTNPTSITQLINDQKISEAIDKINSLDLNSLDTTELLSWSIFFQNTIKARFEHHDLNSANLLFCIWPKYGNICNDFDLRVINIEDINRRPFFTKTAIISGILHALIREKIPPEFDVNFNQWTINSIRAISNPLAFIPEEHSAYLINLFLVSALCSSSSIVGNIETINSLNKKYILNIIKSQLNELLGLNPPDNIHCALSKAINYL